MARARSKSGVRVFTFTQLLNSNGDQFSGDLTFGPTLSRIVGPSSATLKALGEQLLSNGHAVTTEELTLVSNAEAVALPMGPVIAAARERFGLSQMAVQELSNSAAVDAALVATHLGLMAITAPGSQAQ